MRHLWTVVCFRAVLDKYTNRLSLHEVLDELTIVAGQRVPESLEAKAALPLHLEVATQWERSDIDVPEEGECRIELVTATGERGGAGSLRVDLTTAPRSRVILRFDQLPLAGLGRYQFVVWKRQDGQDWEDVDQIPLYVKLEEAAAEDTPEPVPQDQPKKKRPKKKT